MVAMSQFVHCGAAAPRAARYVSYFSARAVKMAVLKMESDQACAISPVLYLRHFSVIVRGTLKENFAGFVHFLLVWWGHDGKFGVCGEILKAI